MSLKKCDGGLARQGPYRKLEIFRGYKELQGTSRNPKRTSRDLKLPQGTLRDLKGPQGTSSYLNRPQGTSRDLKGAFKLYESTQIEANLPNAFSLSSNT